jgi:hypothetical protein
MAYKVVTYFSKLAFMLYYLYYFVKNRMDFHLEQIYYMNDIQLWTVSTFEQVENERIPTLNIFEKWMDFPRLVTWKDFHGE